MTSGASLVMVDKPIGLKQSSPMVRRNKVPTNQNGETTPP